MRRRARITQVVLDQAPRPIAECRILDLACFHGDFGAEFAARGAEVIGLEGRADNLAEARAKHRYPTLSWIQGDVRKVSQLVSGRFDVVLCLGILYHLDAPECFELLEGLANVSDGLTVIDTHVSLRDKAIVRHKGRDYHGWFYREYSAPPTEEEQAAATWASIGNTRSFWPTAPSLVNAVAAAGFTSVYQCLYPATNDMPADRVTLLAWKKPVSKLLANADDQAIYGERLDERPTVLAESAKSTFRLKVLGPLSRWLVRVR